jgi:hypothetical protein
MGVRHLCADERRLAGLDYGVVVVVLVLEG